MEKLKKEVSYLEVYKTRMEAHDFLIPYMEDSADIFNISSPICKQFLINSFAHLDPYFHYLPFSNKDEIDKELLKAAQILQIHPRLPKKEKIFEGLDAVEVHKFWMRFFSHFDLCQEENKSYSSFEFYNEKPSFLNITDAVNYFNYEFQIVNPNNVKKADLNSELKKWDALEPVEIISEDVSVESPVINTNEDINIDKPIHGVKYLVDKYELLNLKSSKESSGNEEFFENFKNMAKNVKDYLKNIEKIQSFSKKNIVCDLVAASNDFDLPNMNQIRRCQELFSQILSKKKNENDIVP